MIASPFAALGWITTSIMGSLYQFMAERPNVFTWEYLEQGPEIWPVEIGKAG